MHSNVGMLILETRGQINREWCCATALGLFDPSFAATWPHVSTYVIGTGTVDRSSARATIIWACLVDWMPVQ